MPTGFTLPELLVIIVVMACLGGATLPRIHRTLDRAAVRGARTEIVSLLAQTRHLAIARRAVTAIRFRADGTVVLSSGADTFATRQLRTAYRVTLTASRDSIAYAPTGRGHGAANSTVIVRRGAASDTVVISRLGRVR